MQSAPPAAAAVKTSPPANIAKKHQTQAGRFYRVNSSKSSYTELWRDTRSPAVLIAWIAKILRLKLPGSVNDPNVVSLRPFVVRTEDVPTIVPDDVIQKMAPMLRELTELGFGKPLYFWIDDRFHISRTAQVVLLHREGRSVARVTHRAEGAGYHKHHFFCEFLSALSDKRILQSSSARAQEFVPDAVELVWKYKSSPSQLWIEHRKKMDELRAGGLKFYSIPNRKAAFTVAERHHHAIRDFQIGRGVFQPLNEDELADIETLDRHSEQAASGQARHPDVLAHLERLQLKKSNPVSSLVVLLVSIGVFVALGMSVWGGGWKYILVIVGILLVHEAGHFIAMRMLGYRNVRMFFIPLLGAAVTGQHYTAPGWKKVVVALMGPLPGIFLGGIAGVVAMVYGNDTLSLLALATIALNALQLIPVMPFDGGRVMHTLIFSRNYYLEAIFQVVAVIALIGMGALAGGRIMTGLGVAMLIGVFHTFKVAKIASTLKQRGFGHVIAGALHQPTAYANEESGVPAATAAAPPTAPPTAPTDEPPVLEYSNTPNTSEFDTADGLIPQPVAEAIVDETQKNFPNIKAPKMVAEMSLRVFEVMASRPPGVLASVGFGILHAASFIFALVMVAVLIVGRGPNLGWAMGMPWDMDAGQVPLVVDNIQNWSSTDEMIGDTVRATNLALADEDDRAVSTYQTLAINFFDDAAALKGFESIKAAAPATARLMLFGRTVLLRVAKDDSATTDRWINMYETTAETVFMIDAVEGASVTLTVDTDSVVAPAVLESSLKSYFNNLELPLIPPWSAGGPLDERTAEERRRHEAARAFALKLNGVEVYDDPVLDPFRKKIERAARLNQDKQIQKIRAEMEAKQNELIAAAQQKIRDDAVDSELREFADVFIAFAAEQRELLKTISVIEDGGDFEKRYAEYDKANKALQQRRTAALAPYMGAWPTAEDEDDETAERRRRLSARYGFVYSEDSNEKIQVSVSLIDIMRGLPALLEWLQAEGATNPRYAIEQPYGGYYD